MWPNSFRDRLAAWHSLRQDCKTGDLESCVFRINQWWFNCPWSPYYLHWDDQAKWPDPWQLLDDNIFCPLARALGIVYTCVLVERPDLQDCELSECGGDNLVLINNGKYILNWDPGLIVNINPEVTVSGRRLKQQEIAVKLL